MKIALLDTPEARGKRIRFVRDHLLSLTREEFCKDTDITTASIKGWELGWGGGLTSHGAEKIIKRAKKLNVYCTAAWLMYGIGHDAIYLLEDMIIQENDFDNIAKELVLFNQLHKSIYAIVKDDGMAPLLYPGNYVSGIIYSRIENAINKDCIAIDNNNDVYIRILKPGSKKNLFNLLCLNQSPDNVKSEIKNISLKIVAPIIWIRRLHLENNV